MLLHRLVCAVMPSAVLAGGFTALMPHPERVSRHLQMSWSAGDVSALSPWARMFANARRWVG